MAQIGTIQGIAVDHSGNIYLSDTDRNLIRKVDTRGIITTIAGNGIAGFSGDGGPATSAALNLPYGLAADLNGNVYVADLGNNRIRRINPDGSIVTVAGTGVKGSVGDGGQGVSAQLMTPRNVAVDSAGTLYISEFEGHRIRKVAVDGTISTYAGTGVAGFRGDGGLATFAQIAYPAGLALDRSGNLYIADSQNQRIRKVLPGGVISTVLGGSPSIALSTPIAVAVDGAGTIYAADATDIVRSYTTAGVWSSAAGTGLPGFAGDGGPANKALLTDPRDLAVDVYGNLLIADSVRIRQVNGSQVISTIAGDGYLHAVGDGGPATSAILHQPSAVALDHAGNLYIADPGTQRIREVLPSGVIQTFAGTGAAGYNSDQIPAATAELSSPAGAFVDAYGEVFIADSNNQRVRMVGQNAKIATYAGTGVAGLGPELQPAVQTELRTPSSVCIGLNGTTYIVDTGNSRVLQVVAGQPVQVAAGNGTPGYAGDGGQARSAELNGPSACALDSAGDLFIADSLNHRIAKVTSAGVISTVAGTGTPGFSGDEGPAIAATLAVPKGLAVDDNGDIYIADSVNNRIRQVTPDGVIHTIAGTGAAAFGGDGDVALNALLNTPEGMLLDGSGNLYFADTGNNRVRVLTPATPPAQVVTPPPATPPITVENAASLQSGPVAPGELVSIFGTYLGPQVGVPGAFDSSGLYANLLASSEVHFDGVPAPLFYTQAGQINAQAPFTIAGQSTTHVEVFYQGQLAGAADVPVVPTAPAVFPTILNQDGTLNSASNPAASGTVLTLFASGAGASVGGDVAGQVAQAPYSQPLGAVSVIFGASNANILYAGAAPGEVGVLQVNLQIPAGTASGQATLQLTVGASPAPLITVWIQ